MCEKTRFSTCSDGVFAMEFVLGQGKNRERCAIMLDNGTFRSHQSKLKNGNRKWFHFHRDVISSLISVLW